MVVYALNAVQQNPTEQTSNQYADWRFWNCGFETYCLFRQRSMNSKVKGVNRQPPPMTVFEIDDVVSILMGVKPPAKEKSRKQKSSMKSKKLDWYYISQLKYIIPLNKGNRRKELLSVIDNKSKYYAVVGLMRGQYSSTDLVYHSRMPETKSTSEPRDRPKFIFFSQPLWINLPNETVVLL